MFSKTRLTACFFAFLLVGCFCLPTNIYAGPEDVFDSYVSADDDGGIILKSDHDLLTSADDGESNIVNIVGPNTTSVSWYKLYFGSIFLVLFASLGALAIRFLIIFFVIKKCRSLLTGKGYSHDDRVLATIMSFFFPLITLLVCFVIEEVPCDEE